MLRNFFLIFLLFCLFHKKNVHAQITVQNFISNGDFSQNNCSRLYCISNDINMVKDWIPDPMIEIGYASKYTDHFESRTQRMMELVAQRNTCVKQQIPFLAPGVYTLSIDYVARKNFPVTNGQFSIELNSMLMKRITPSKYETQTENFQLELKKSCAVELRLCGTGVDTRSDGAVIKLVKLVSSTKAAGSPPLFDPCPSTGDPGIYFSSLSTNCYSKEYSFKGGELEMTYDYSIVSPTAVSNTFLKVFVDNVQKFSVPPTENGKTLVHNLTALPQGTHTVKFCPQADVNQIAHTIKVSNVLIKQIFCQDVQSNNLVKNGGFQESSCKSTWCRFTLAGWANHMLVGWIPKDELEVGSGSFYNTNYINTNAIQLDSAISSCLFQYVPLQPLKQYNFSFTWAAKMGIGFASQGHTVKINGQLIQSKVPTDYLMHYESFLLTFTNTTNLTTIQFCGLGTNDHYGTAIDNISITTFLKCANQENYRYGPFPLNFINTTGPNVSLTSSLNVTTSVISVSSIVSSCTELKYNLLGGKLKAQFDFSIDSVSPVSFSALMVKVDNKLMGSIHCSKKGQRVSVQLAGVSAGQHLLKFCPYPNEDDPQHTYKISNIYVQENQCTAGWSQNMIINGGFQMTICKTYCKYYEGFQAADYVPGWTPFPEIEIGVGNYYNSDLVYTNIIELDATRNTCVRQFLALKVGKYVLTYHSSARSGTAFTSMGYEVKVNSRVIKRAVPIHYLPVSERVQFEIITLESTTPYIQFCGFGTTDDRGSIIDNVTLIHYNDCYPYKRYSYSS